MYAPSAESSVRNSAPRDDSHDPLCSICTEERTSEYFLVAFNFLQLAQRLHARLQHRFC